jgi:hypothetical protein
MPKLRIHEAEAPAGLYWHYTDFDGCNPIIANGRMWATNIEYLNDAAEFRYSLDLIKSIFERPGVLPDVGLPRTPTQVYQSLLPYISYMLDLGLYVTCFSKQPDDLSQWRGYANNIPGFAIGFDPTLLRNRLERWGFVLQDCIYDPSDQEAVVRSEISQMFGRLTSRKGFADMGPGEKVLALDGVSDHYGLGSFVEIAARFKSQKFKSENEVRAIRRSFSRDIDDDKDPHAPLQLKYRRSRTLVVPFWEWSLRKSENEESPIKCVMVGPGPHKHEVATAVNDLCHDHRVNALVTTSRIAFRNW